MIQLPCAEKCTELLPPFGLLPVKGATVTVTAEIEQLQQADGPRGKNISYFAALGSLQPRVRSNFAISALLGIAFPAS